MIHVRGSFWCALICCFSAGLFNFQVVCGIGLSARDQLIQGLLTDYHSSVEPAGIVDLRLGLALVCVRFDKATATQTTTAWERYTWTDVRLSWNPKDFDGIKRMRVPPHLIWKPDIYCYNSLEKEVRSHENVLIESDGTITWAPRSFLKTLCTMEEGKPVCDLSFGSWMYDAWSMSIELHELGIDTNTYLNTTCPWQVENYTAAIKTTTYPCCKDAYTSLDVTLNLKPLHAEEPVASPSKK